MLWGEECILSCFLCPGQKEELGGTLQGARLGGSGRLGTGGWRAQHLSVNVNPIKGAGVAESTPEEDWSKLQKGVASPPSQPL